jgi:hypothetical protein
MVAMLNHLLWQKRKSKKGKGDQKELNIFSHGINSKALLAFMQRKIKFK